MERMTRLAEASAICRRAATIAAERGVDDNTAYELAEREIETTPGPFSVEQTAHGVTVRKGPYWLHLDAHQVEQVLRVGRRYLTTHRRDLKIERRRVLVRAGR